MKIIYNYVIAIANETSIFQVKIHDKKLKILSSKSTQNTEEATPLKSLFELSRYLDRLPRYKDSKCQ